MNAFAKPLTFLLVAASAACGAPRERPAALGALDAIAESSEYRTLAERAPSEMAAVEGDRARAKEAADQGDSTSAELYVERAQARLQQAKLVLERSELEARARRAEPLASEAEAELKLLAVEQVDADKRIAELTLRSKLAADTEPRAASAEASGARQRARAQAARSFTTEAQLLCSAARLLRPSAKDGAAAPDSLATAEAAAAAPKDYDAAVQARLGCLSALQSVRRAVLGVGVSSQRADALLEQLSASARYELRRDERGVVLTLPSEPSEEQLRDLAAIARQRPAQLVVHHASANAPNAKARARDREPGQRVYDALLAGGAEATKLVFVQAVDSLPRVDPQGALRADNERIELVFVQ